MFFFSPQRIWHSYPNYDMYFTDHRPSCFYCRLLLFSWPLYVSLLVSSPIHSCSSVFPFVNRLHQHITLLTLPSPLVSLLIFPLGLLPSTASSRSRRKFSAFHSAAWYSLLLRAVITGNLAYLCSDTHALAGCLLALKYILGRWASERNLQMKPPAESKQQSPPPETLNIVLTTLMNLGQLFAITTMCILTSEWLLEPIKILVILEIIMPF